MYADDLVLFGFVDEVEVTEINHIMNKFREMSGLKINNEKSVV
jgi:hypothetical protein